MAKISFVDPAFSVNLHAQGDKIFLRLGSFFRRRRSKPPPEFRKHPSKKRWLRSLKRSEVNSITREISEHWQSLSQAQRAAWITYSSSFPLFRNGYQAFFSNNMRLLRSNHPSFAWCENITSPPIAVVAPAGVCVFFVTVTSSFSVTWVTPVCIALFVQCFEWIPPGLRRSRSFRWSYVDTAYSLDASLIVPLTFLDTGRQATLALRAVNLRGEISTNLLPGTFTKDTMARGSYGYAYYGYAFYGD